MDSKTIAELTAQIVSSSASKKEMGKDEIVAMIKEVSAELKAIDAPVEEVPVTTEPVATEPIMKPMASIKKNEIICLICGKGGFKTLTRHLRKDHGIEPKDYKKQFGIPAKVSLMSKDYATTRAELAKTSNVGARMLEGKKKAAEKKAAEKGGTKKKSLKPQEVVQVPAE